jgi:hypothetical protein
MDKNLHAIRGNSHNNIKTHKMKKLFTLGVIAAMALAASAKDYQVYNNGTLAAGVSPTWWWNATYTETAENPTDASAQAYMFKTTDGGTDGSFGLLVGDNNITGPLHSATLNFSWYAVGTGDYTIRVTGDVEQNYSFAVTADNAGKWNTISLPMSENFAQVAEKWEAGETGYIFAVVVSNASSDAVFYFDNVYYSGLDEAWVAPAVEEKAKPTTVPTPEQPAENVKSLYSNAYTPAVSHGIGGWGQSTQVEEVTIDGKAVNCFTKFNYLGWESFTLDVSDMDHLHVDMWTPDGEGFGFTPISLNPTAEKGWSAPEVKLEEWNSYDVELSYYNDVDLTAIQQFKFDGGNKGTYYIANVYFYKSDSTEPEEPGTDPEEPGTDPIVTAGATYEGELAGVYTQTLEGVATDYPYTLKYKIVYNEDKTLTVTGGYEYTTTPVGAENFQYVQIWGGTPNFSETYTTIPADVTTTQVFEAGETVKVAFKHPVAAGAIEPQFDYVVGSSNAESGVAAVAVDANAPVVYYNLQGARVANPENGIFIRVQGNRATKVAL